MSKPWPEEISTAAQGAYVTAVFHPFTYARVLIQLGHEPLPPTIRKSWGFGRPVVRYPSVFKYVDHIRKSEGFLGMYSGLGANVIGSFASIMIATKIYIYFTVPDENQGKPLDELDGAVPSLCLFCQVWAIRLSQECVARVCGIVASHPFQVIMVRQMAQFVGHETNYTGFFASIKEIYHNDGISGFFAGLVPRALYELATIVLTDILIKLIKVCLMRRSDQCPNIIGISSGACNLLASNVTYPLSLVSHVMAVNGSGLQAGEPTYADWRVCYAQLSAAKQLRRGSGLLWSRVVNDRNDIMPSC